MTATAANQFTGEAGFTVAKARTRHVGRAGTQREPKDIVAPRLPSPPNPTASPGAAQSSRLYLTHTPQKRADELLILLGRRQLSDGLSIKAGGAAKRARIRGSLRAGRARGGAFGHTRSSHRAGREGGGTRAPIGRKLSRSLRSPRSDWTVSLPLTLFLEARKRGIFALFVAG